MKQLLILACLFSVLSAVWAQDAFHDVPFETVALGRVSGCVRPAKMVIDNPREWQRVWDIHTRQNGTAAPKVDFRNQVVLAILSGQGFRATTVGAIVRGPREMLVYSLDEAAPDGLPSQPFHFAAVTRPNVPIRFASARGATCVDCPR